MRILHLLYESYGDSFGIGGVGVRAYQIARRLGASHEVTFLCKKYPGAKDGRIHGIPHIFTGTESPSLTRTLLGYARGCRSFVREKGSAYDVIVEEFSPGVPTFLSDRSCGKPVVLQLQSYYGTQYFRKYNPATAATLYWLERTRPLRYRRFIVVNETLVGRYRMNGKDRSITIIGNGVEESLLDVPERPGEDILFLGRIDIHNKGLDILLEAFSRISTARPGTRLVIAGDGRDASRFRTMVEACPANVRERIVMTGWVEDDDKSRVLREARLVVLPSRYEAQPITTLEAMAAARPLVVSPIDELRYVADGGAGLAMGAFSAGALAEGIETLLDDAELARRLGERGRGAAQNHTWEQVAARFEDYLFRVVTGPRSPQAGR